MAVAAARSRPSVTATVREAIWAASESCPACSSTFASWPAISVLGPHCRGGAARFPQEQLGG